MKDSINRDWKAAESALILHQGAIEYAMRQAFGLISDAAAREDDAWVSSKLNEAEVAIRKADGFASSPSFILAQVLNVDSDEVERIRGEAYASAETPSNVHMSEATPSLWMGMEYIGDQRGVLAAINSWRNRDAETPGLAGRLEARLRVYLQVISWMGGDVDSSGNQDDKLAIITRPQLDQLRGAAKRDAEDLESGSI